MPDKQVEDEVRINPVELTVAHENPNAVILVTGHEQYRELSPVSLIDYVGSESFIVVDGRHVFDPDDLTKTAVDYRGVGRGSHE